MRNAVQRRNHRERGQPEERAKWGLLEKHKDYSARARDFNQKKSKLKALRQKVLDKNPDEFYFGMMSRKGPATMGKNRTGTVNGDRGNEVLSQNAARLFKTQDLGYVRTMRNKALKEVEELEKRSKGIQGEGKKMIFVGDEEEQRRKLEDVDMDEDEDQDEDDKAARRLRKMQEKEADKLEAKLTVARERLKALTDAEEALELQRAKMAKSPTVGGVTKQGVKFKVRERKR
ncbi:U3 small nucleolar RNA-associated protein-like protein Utp11 [Hyaloscypha bicolor E]|uniref:U3 small nucleolar RNA-associated protein-like protein Utp11 n=1 Tax=Hyaloscypha bicolor E TaxID=1095630 RepID=A0A2J6TE54_9HELO|nr:U3 small nucleolar RNA-associated protein-like protein Utp11 [Hyaloscypha bicolor E]PMD61300.1 U3 small nucleolar RNA-associated protein-like protein Utp11 [Hyaloscypha bicolor E]